MNDSPAPSLRAFLLWCLELDAYLEDQAIPDGEVQR